VEHPRPPRSAWGWCKGAVYDAVNAIEPKHHRPYLLERRFAATASKEAAVATAAYTVLANIVSTVPPSIPFPSKESVLQSLASHYASSLAPIPDSPFKAQGNHRGRSGGGGDDRREEGRWAVRTVAVGAELRTRTLAAPHQSGDGTAHPRPDPLGRRREAFPHAELVAVPHCRAEVAHEPRVRQRLQRGEGARRGEQPGSHTRADVHRSLVAESSVASWNAVARDLVAREDIDVVDSARLFAMENLAAADAAINCWNDKYYWDFWRPWNAIPRAAEDGNAATEPDPTWTALITAPYPEHPSGHLCLDGAHTRVLQMFFDTDAPEGRGVHLFDLPANRPDSVRG
jgi:hypothetical protein